MERSSQERNSRGLEANAERIHDRTARKIRVRLKKHGLQEPNYHSFQRVFFFGSFRSASPRARSNSSAQELLLRNYTAISELSRCCQTLFSFAAEVATEAPVSKSALGARGELLLYIEEPILK